MCAKNAQVQTEGNRVVERIVSMYNVDVVLSIENKVKSKNGELLQNYINYFLSKNHENNHETIIIYNNGNVSLPVTISPSEETVWLTKEQLVILFDTTRQNVEYHIENIYEQRELEAKATCKEFLQVQLKGDRNL